MQLLDPRRLTHFAAVYEHRHFTRAAQALYVDTGVLSRSIRALERDLKVKLFDRGPGRPVEPTPAANRLALETDRMMRGLADLPSAVRGDEAGTDRVRVGVLGVGLGSQDAGEIMRCWRRSWPDVRLEYVPLTAENHDRAVLEGTVDLAVQQLGIAEPAELVTHVAYRSPRAVVVPMGSEFADADLLHPGDLQDEEFLFADVSGRLGEVWADLPVMEGSRDTVLAEPAHVSPAVFTTGRIGCNALAARDLGVYPGTKFVALEERPVDIGVAMLAGEQPPAVEALYRAVELCTVTGPLEGP